MPRAALRGRIGSTTTKKVGLGEAASSDSSTSSASSNASFASSVESSECDNSDDEDDEDDDDDDDDDDDSCSSYLSSDDEEFMKTEQLIVMSNMPTSIKKVASFNDLNKAEMSSTQIQVMLKQMRLTHGRNDEIDESDMSGRSLPATLPSSQTPVPRSRFLHRASVTGIQRTSAIIGTEMASEDESGEDLTPTDTLQIILKDNGFAYKAFPSADLDDYFVKVTPDRIKNYSTDIICAIQTSDLNTLRKMCFEEKRNLDCCNKFGESVLHTACRRGLPEVVNFLIHEAKVDLRVRDDYGRTPMHDACWTSEPNFLLIKLLVTEWPDLMLVADARGFTPLQYVRSNHFAAWCHFLKENCEIIRPKHLVKPTGE